MKGFAFIGWLAGAVAATAAGCIVQMSNAAQEPTPQANDVQELDKPVPVTMTCGEFIALLKGDKRTTGTVILWLDGYYSGRSGLPELPVGWVRTVGQGIGGTCAIGVNDRRTVLDVIGQLHREYADHR